MWAGGLGESTECQHTPQYTPCVVACAEHLNENLNLFAQKPFTPNPKPYSAVFRLALALAPKISLVVLEALLRRLEAVKRAQKSDLLFLFEPSFPLRFKVYTLATRARQTRSLCSGVYYD